MASSRDLSIPAHLERRYTRGGRKAHLVSTLNTTGSLGATAPYAYAQCGRQPALFDAWYGSGTQDEEERAAALPLCRICAETVAQQNFLDKVWGKGTLTRDHLNHKPQEGRCIADGQPWPCKTRIKELTSGAAPQAG